jgi:hypothetical protein
VPGHDDRAPAPGPVTQPPKTAQQTTFAHVSPTFPARRNQPYDRHPKTRLNMRAAPAWAKSAPRLTKRENIS